MIKEEWKYRIDGGMIWPIKGKELLTKEVKKYANQIKGSNKKLQQKAWNDVHIKMINHGMPNSITEKKLRRYYFQTTRTERKSVNLSMSDSLLSESPEYEYQMKNKKISIMDTPAKFYPIFHSSMQEPINVEKTLIEADVEMKVEQSKIIKLKNKSNVKSEKRLTIKNIKQMQMKDGNKRKTIDIQMENKIIPTIIEMRTESIPSELDSIRMKIAQTELTTILMQLQQEEDNLMYNRQMYAKRIALLDMEIEIRMKSLEF